ncbi:MAG: hypothetical protein RXN88_00890 [Acidilobus sp.]
MRGSSPACSATGSSSSVAVLDTGALIASLQLRLPLTCVTTPQVYDEVKDEESRSSLELSLSLHKLIIVAPSQDFLEAALREAGSADVAGRLSKADLSVLALALELAACGKEAFIATDDYSLQAAAAKAGIKVIRVRYAGIRELRGHRGAEREGS